MKISIKKLKCGSTMDQIEFVELLETTISICKFMFLKQYLEIHNLYRKFKFSRQIAYAKNLARRQKYANFTFSICVLLILRLIDSHNILKYMKIHQTTIS